MSDSAKPNKGNKKEIKGGKNKKKNIFKSKRAGTSGIRGQLYETKLLGLILFKILQDEEIEEFYLATNVDEIGMFDDICLRAKLKGFDIPINVFIQAKHRENDKLLTLNNKKDLTNCFNSYLSIKRRFQPGNDDVLFQGNFNEIDCVFVMYTTAKDDGTGKPCEGDLVTYLNRLISTGNPGSQPSYTDEDMDLLCQQILEEQLITLGQKIARYILDDAKSQIMNDELVLRYHFILGKEVFDISNVLDEGHRMASFKSDFFSETLKFIKIFKHAFCSEIIEKRKIDITNEIQELLASFLSEPDDIENLSKLIRGSVVTFKHGKPEFRDKVIPHQYKETLEGINNNNRVKNEALELAVKESLKHSLEFKVPATFGNKDLAIRGDDKKIDKRLDHLCKKLVDVIEKTEGDKIIIDETMDDGFLRLNGGIASAVGNLIVYDDNCNLFKFCEDCESLDKVAKRFHKLLKSKIQHFENCRFDIRAKVFPKLSLDRSEYDELIVKDFFSKLMFYTSQGDENDVEEKIIDEIKRHQAKQVQLNNPIKKSEAIFLRYHDEIQKWWMVPKEGEYLTKDSDLYMKAVDSTSAFNMMTALNLIRFSQRVVYVENGRVIESYDPTERDTPNRDRPKASCTVA
ncbi:hypothetical protein PYW08_012806 [Mythimna loreyi]|uniref:Uncharacterized protein n=1 Tax=Mythimna loreyi TaxID=667449 RepID=A0ACC2Q1S2_9NEOP|nr:hypothetical protein PYW08_012806 [Mythimna loreyi]